MTTKIRKLSKKRAKQNAQYLKLKDQFLEENPWCDCDCGRRSSCVHHMKGRIGSLLTDVNFFLAVCVVCHDKIERNPQWAKENGFSLSRLAV